jgi:hypothetical protein
MHDVFLRCPTLTTLFLRTWGGWLLVVGFNLGGVFGLATHSGDGYFIWVIYEAVVVLISFFGLRDILRSFLWIELGEDALFLRSVWPWRNIRVPTETVARITALRSTTVGCPVVGYMLCFVDGGGLMLDGEHLPGLEGFMAALQGRCAWITRSEVPADMGVHVPRFPFSRSERVGITAADTETVPANPPDVPPLRTRRPAPPDG